MTHNTNKDYIGAKIGMWLFLFTEILLFGGLFVLYSVYLHRYPEEFHLAGSELNVYFGTANTLVLLTSSFSMALSITALQKGNKKLCMILLTVTMILACVFLVNKYFEWAAKIHHGIYPDSPTLLERPKGEIIFFGLYYTMTGLHGLHVLIGALIIFVVLILVAKNRVTSSDFVAVENTGLYWHLVDMIWIYLFPLFYLVV